MTPIEQFIETRVLLSKSACPSCGNQSLELRLFCERGDNCQHIAVCTHCHIKLEVQAGKLSPELAYVLRDLACPACSKKAAEFAMVCQLPTRSCDPAIVCIACGHAYIERVPATV